MMMSRPTPMNDSIKDMASQEAERFNEDGYVVLKDAQVVKWDLIAKLRTEAFRCFHACLDEVKEHNLELGIGAKEGFAEIVQRHQGRYEMRYGLDDHPIFRDPWLVDNPKLKQVLDMIFDSHGSHDQSSSSNNSNNDSSSNSSSSSSSISTYHLLDKSIIIALPQTTDQAWHADGAHLCLKTHQPCHCLNVFIPLIDITNEKGPTEFKPGSHVYTRDLTRLMLVAKAKKTLREAQCPLLKQGQVLLFDYRILHRGRGNSSSEPRPILVLTFARTGFKDVFNFPERSLKDYQDAKTVTYGELKLSEAEK